VYVICCLAKLEETAFILVDRHGQPVVVRPEARESGQALLPHFWATWCPDFG
jgi:hypothetical protein